MEQIRNEMKMEFLASSMNEGFARITVGAFVAELNPTVDELADIKTASIKANPIPDRSSSGLVVNKGSLACATSRIPFPVSTTEISTCCSPVLH